MKKLILASLLLSTALLAAGSAYAAALYFPHVASNFPWQTEIALINTSDQTVTGTLRGLSDEGQLIETKAVTHSARGRRQITVADEFTNHADIGYIIFDTNSAAVQGYTKFSIAGYYRAAIPAVKEVNTSDIYISHIASSAEWWTGVSLVNTTSATKELTIAFNDGQSVPYTLNPNEHKVFTIGSLLNQELQPEIQSAVITNASGIIGLELFGSKGGATQLDGVLLTDKTTSTIYYPHVGGDGWWTGIVAYNPSASSCTITITPYSAQGTALTPLTPPPIPGKGKYIGAVAALGLPAQTAWFRIDSTSPLSGFELFGTVDGKQLAAYAGMDGTNSKAGVFAKIEKNGWTGIAFVNTEAGAASVTLTAYNDNGTAVATQMLPVDGHAKVVNNPELIFSQDISGATYIAYSSDRNVVGFQLNGSSDGMMLDGLPGLGVGGGGAVSVPPQAHISYRDNTNGDLKYATDASGAWAIATVDSGGDVGYNTSLALDSSGKAHISYYDATNGDLKYATNTLGVWVMATVDSGGAVGLSNSLALDSSGKAHISYYDATNGYLKYVTNASGAWVAATVDSGGIVGLSPSLAFDLLGKAHISYYDLNNRDLKYATNASGAWVTATVDSGGDVGYNTSLALDSSGKSHISYLDQTNGALKYATNALGVWVMATVDSGGDVGFSNSLALDSSGKAHISYFDAANGDLKYVTNASGAWVTATVDSVGSVGRFTSLALDSLGKAHISYYDATKKDLKYATNALGSWFTATVDSVGDVGWDNSIKVR